MDVLPNDISKAVYELCFSIADQGRQEGEGGGGLPGTLNLRNSLKLSRPIKIGASIRH